MTPKSIAEAREKAIERVRAANKGDDIPAFECLYAIDAFVAALSDEGLVIVPRGALEGALHDIEDGQLEGAIKMLAAALQGKEPWGCRRKFA